MFPPPPALPSSFVVRPSRPRGIKPVVTHRVERIQEQAFISNPELLRYVIINGDEKYNPIWCVTAAQLAQHVELSTGNNGSFARMFKTVYFKANPIVAHVTKLNINGQKQTSTCYLITHMDVMSILKHHSTHNKQHQHIRDKAKDLFDEIEFRDTVLGSDKQD